MRNLHTYIQIYVYCVPVIVQNLSSEIVLKNRVCVDTFKECKGMEDQAVAFVAR